MKECSPRNFSYCLEQTKEPCAKKFKGPTYSKVLGILQTEQLNVVYPCQTVMSIMSEALHCLFIAIVSKTYHLNSGRFRESCDDGMHKRVRFQS